MYSETFSPKIFTFNYDKRLRIPFSYLLIYNFEQIPSVNMIHNRVINSFLTNHILQIEHKRKDNNSISISVELNRLEKCNLSAE